MLQVTLSFNSLSTHLSIGPMLSIHLPCFCCLTSTIQAYGLFYAPTEEITDIERERAKTIMRNNQVLRSLGVPALAEIVNSSIAKSKGKVREESDPLYEPEDMEETGDDVLDDEVFAIKLLLHLHFLKRSYFLVPHGYDRITYQVLKHGRLINSSNDLSVSLIH